MMSIQAVIVGFAFVSFVQDSFEAGQLSVHASGNQKAAGRQRRVICELLCRSKRENKPHLREDFDLCLWECNRNKGPVQSSSSLEIMESLRSRRNTNQQGHIEDDCKNPKEYVKHPAQEPSSIKVDYLTRKPNLSITWSPVRPHLYYNWTSYAVHYKGSGDGEDSPISRCKLIPKEQHQLILQDGDGWKYPDAILVAIVTYPHGKYDSFSMHEFGPTPRPPPPFPTKSVADSSTKLIAAISGAGVGLGLLLVFVFLVYRKQINICKRGDVDEHRIVSPIVNNDLQLPGQENNTSDPKKNTSGPDTFYACYFAESQWFQVQVASVVNYFRQNGYTVEMDVMNSSERIDLGPTRWAEQQIRKARNVLVFLSPGLLRLCGGDGEETDISHQEHDRQTLWYELDLLRKIYAQTHSARKMVCIILPNTTIDPGDLPLWAEMRYRWPEDEMNILKRLNDRPIIQPW